MKSGENGQALRELAAIVRISGPLAAAYLAEIAMGIIDMVIVGRVGSVELAGVGLASSVLFEILIISVGVVSIVAVLAAEARGAGSTEGVRHSVRQGFLMALLLGVPGAMVGFYLAPLLAMTGQDPEVIVYADRYLRAATWFIVPYLLFVVLRSFLAAVARASAVMYVTVAAVGVNALLSYGLVFGELGLPRMGVAGAGWEVRTSAATGIGLGTAVMVVSASVLWLFPEEIVSVFLDVGDPANAEVVAYAVVLAGIAAVFQLFDGLQAVAARALRGLKDTLVPMWIASVGYWVLGLLGGWILCFPLGYGAPGLWWGLALGLIATGSALVWRLMLRTRLN